MESAGFACVVTTLEVHNDDAGICEEACLCLSSMTYGSEAKQQDAGAAGAVEAVVAAAKSHPTNPAVQQAASQGLMSLAFDADNAERAAAAGAIESIVAALNQHPHSADVSTWACWALAHVLWDRSPSRQALAWAAGAGPAITAAKGRHPKSPEVAEKAALALDRLGEGVAEFAVDCASTVDCCDAEAGAWPTPQEAPALAHRAPGPPQVEREMREWGDIVFIKERTSYKSILYKTYFVFEARGRGRGRGYSPY